MSAMTLAPLLAAGTATAVSAAALHAAHGLRKQVTALRKELAAAGLGGPADEALGTVPAARRTPAEEIRAAVADALAEERERELAEARAFWAAQEARDASDGPALFGGLPGLSEDAPLFVPRQADPAGPEIEPLDQAAADLAEAMAETESLAEALAEIDAEPPNAPSPSEPSAAELAAARRRHPSHPDFTPAPAVADHERTIARLAELSHARIPLTDVRPGPLGTLDVYVFGDGTTVCMTPGHRETAERLAGAVRRGEAPVLMGGSGVAGAYAVTFACGAENVYVLADRVIASF